MNMAPGSQNSPYPPYPPYPPSSPGSMRTPHSSSPGSTSASLPSVVTQGEVPFFPSDIVIEGPQHLSTADGNDTVARKHLPMLNGLLDACHMSLVNVTSIKGLSQIIDMSLKVMKQQRTILGLENGSRRSSPKGNPVPVIPD